MSQPPGFIAHRVPSLGGQGGHKESGALTALREPENREVPEHKSLGHRLGGTCFGVCLLSNYCM